MLLLLCSCTKGEIGLEIETSSPDKTLINLASKIYTDSELSDIVKFSGTIDELNAKYPIECLRKNKNTYRVSYLGNGSVALITFDNAKNKIIGKVYNALQLKSDFSDLKNGQSLEKVKKIDPNGDFTFLYTGRNDTPKISTHCTKDGYLITIKYDISNTIICIKEELI